MVISIISFLPIWEEGRKEGSDQMTERINGHELNGHKVEWLCGGGLIYLVSFLLLHTVHILES